MQYFGSSAVIQFIKAIDALLAFYEPQSSNSVIPFMRHIFSQNCLSFRKKSYICSRNGIEQKRVNIVNKECAWNYITEVIQA